MSTLTSIRASGFTLAETLLTMAFLAISAGAAAPHVATHLEQARVAQAAQDIRRIETALQVYRDQHHALPDSLEQLPLSISYCLFPYLWIRGDDHTSTSILRRAD